MKLENKLVFGKEVEAALDVLTSTDALKPLAANQGRVLKGFIDSISALLLSDDNTLDELQEIVTYIKQNKTDLSALGISNIAGLVDALASKETIVGAQQKADDAETAANSYTDNRITNLAPKTKPEKYITNATQYTAILEDKGKYLVFKNGINFIIPSDIFAKNDVIEGEVEGPSDVTVVAGTNVGATLTTTINKAEPLTPIIPRYGVIGLRFRSASNATLYGTLKPL